MKSKYFQRVVICLLGILIICGIILNCRLIKIVNEKEKEVLLSEEEKKFLEREFIVQDNYKIVNEKYIKLLDEIKQKKEYLNKQTDLAKINYFIGYNSYINADNELARKYFKSAREIFLQLDKKNYFYLLNASNSLMNIAYAKGEYISGINMANEIYQVLQNDEIEGVSKKGQNGIRSNVLAGLLVTASNFEMSEMAKVYYNELCELTENDNFEQNITVYAKYVYSLYIGNLAKAESYAREYLDIIRTESPKYFESSHVYLLDVLIRKNKHENRNEEINEIFKIFAKKYEEEKEIFNKGIIYKLVAKFYKNKEDYNLAYEYYDKAFVEFEKNKDYSNILYSLEQILILSNNLKIDNEKYISLIVKYKKLYNKDSVRGELADSMVKVGYEKINEEKRGLEEVYNKKRKIVDLSKQINLMYLVLILIFAFLLYRMKIEVTARKIKEKELKEFIKVDYLTKAYSRQFIIEKMEVYIKENRSFTFFILDVDNFKKINDTFGHSFGDEVLVNLVAIIQDIIKDRGYIGRFGGEEFAILVDDDININILIQKIKISILGMNLSKNVAITVSGGAIIWKNENINDLIYEADMLLYKAKESGKDRILFDK
ncbi:MAG: GGDEF domain-containing protein [Sarcina sp.]